MFIIKINTIFDYENNITTKKTVVLFIGIPIYIRISRYPIYIEKNNNVKQKVIGYI